MLKRCLSLVLVTSLVCTYGGVATLAATKAEKEARKAEKVKQGILKLGVGPKALVKVKLRDKTALAGYVSEAGADSFVVTDPNTGAATTVAYPQVKSVKGHNLSTGAKIAIGVAIVALVVLIIWAVVHEVCGPEGRCLDPEGT